MRPVAAAMVCLSCGSAWGQQQTIIRSETRLVLVDVVVTDKKGGYVRDLTAGDFKVWEDGKPQTIQSLSLESQPDAGAAARTDYVAVVLDFGGMGAGDQIRARQAADRFIDANAGPNRHLAVANLYENGLDVLQGFTDNAGRLKDAVNGAKAEAINTASSPATRGRTRSQSSDSTERNPTLRLKALSGLVSSLSEAPGRKTVVLLTGNLALPPSQRIVLSDLIETSNRSNVAIYPVDVEDSFVASNLDVSSNSAENGSTFPGVGRGRRGGGGFGVDPDSLPNADPNAENQQFLLTLASGTGGFLIHNSGELPAGMQKIGEEQDQYYVLGYAPPESKEGACHALRVKVDRAGVTVRARNDYCSEKQPELVTKTVSEKRLEQQATGDTAGNIAAAMRLPYFYVSPGVARVHLAMEIPPESIKSDRAKTGLNTIDVLGIASTADGSTAARFTDTVTLTSASGDALPVHYEKQFKIAPGEYKFTLAFSAGGASFGKLEQPLIIGPYQAGQFAISGLALSKEVRTPAAGDQPLGASLFDDRTPLVTPSGELIPTGSASFSKTDHAYCYFEIYKSEAADQPTVTLRLLDATTGQMVWDGGNAKLTAPANGKTTSPVTLTMSTAGFPPGSYQLEVTATAGTTSVRQTASFEIK